MRPVQFDPVQFDPILETPRLRLRAPCRSDATRIAALCADFEVARTTARLPHPYALADAEAFLASGDSLDPAREARFVVDHPAEGLVGFLSFFGEPAPGTEIGYWLGRPYWGAGLMTEAVKAALAWAARDWGRTYVRAWRLDENPASDAVLVKAGFLYTGERRQTLVTSRGEALPSRGMIWLA
jgi:RimJ/RimL family protein N-acetyltransferase